MFTVHPYTYTYLFVWSIIGVKIQIFMQVSETLRCAICLYKPHLSESLQTAPEFKSNSNCYSYSVETDLHSV